jgi:hypothetical protein
MDVARVNTDAGMDLRIFCVCEIGVKVIEAGRERNDPRHASSLCACEECWNFLWRKALRSKMAVRIC